VDWNGDKKGPGDKKVTPRLGKPAGGGSGEVRTVAVLQPQDKPPPAAFVEKRRATPVPGPRQGEAVVADRHAIGSVAKKRLAAGVAG
jgi:hypothetical protein